VPLCEEADLKGEFSMEVGGSWERWGFWVCHFRKNWVVGASVVTCCLAGEALGHAGVDQGHLLALGAHTYYARIPYLNMEHPKTQKVRPQTRQW